MVYRLLRENLKSSLPWKAFFEFRGIYGDIVGFNLFGRQMVVLNSYEAAKDMLGNNAATYSDRPTMTMVGMLIGTEDSAFSLARYGVAWRERRGMLHQLVTRSSMTRLHPALREASLRLLADALENPVVFESTLQQRIGGALLETTYGITAKDAEKLYLGRKGGSGGTFGFIIFGRHLVDYFPVLAYIPWIRLKKEAEFLRAAREKFLDKTFQHALSQDKSLSIVNRLVLSGKNPDSVKLAAGSFYNGGVDTTLVGIKTFLAAMMLYPEVQKKAQEELDEVLGTLSENEVIRLPTFDDQHQLPYLNAVIKEVHRWNPVLPLGMGHAPVKDGIYKGYFIPRDSIIFPNQWGMSRDERYYTEPEKFKPERFLGDSPALDPKEFIFGFGRRKCVGLHFAEAFIFITLASILSAFNITKRTRDHYVEPDLPAGLASFIDEVVCDLTPRSIGTVTLLESLHSSC
ncbi:cytochrome P450 [Cantharellus anzutake]|uniref:cytochrome P450 n=1 Tax=Cantharellus anzutake TaxID=1750568 RepID=UPI001904AD48|nr:cytochrome P450 [Cantharellus anzutake]KAF8343004.1 cytochrome P450 [Cantharellus anzutake]